MTPQEKATKLIDQYRLILIQSETDAGEEILCTTIAKQCSLRAIDEILEFMRMDDEHSDTASNANSVWVNYWLTVKQEIESI
jgi:hypothetical protein